jgi:O-antigen/teichoic acid export membrane protein
VKNFAHLKQLVSESIVYGLAGVLTRFLSFLLVPVYTRIFLPDDYGVMSLVTNTIGLVAIFVVFGLDSAAARWFYDTDESEQQKRTIATWAWFQIVVSTVIGGAIVVFSDTLSVLLVAREDAAIYLRLLAFALPLGTLGTVVINWLRLQRRPWATAMFALGTNLLTIMLTLLFVVVLRLGLKGVFLSQLATALVSTLIAVLLMGAWVSPAYFDRRQLIDMLKFSFPLIPASISYWIVNLSGIYFIKGFSTTSEVGLYQVGSSFASAMAILTAAFQQALGPFSMSIHKREDAAKVYADILTAYTLTACLFSLLLSLFATEILSLVTTKTYLGASRIVGILSFNYVVTGFIYIASIGMNIAKTTRPYGVAVVTASILTVVLNAVFVPHFGKEGAALSTLIAQAFVPVFVFYAAQKLYPIPYRFAAVTATFVLAFGIALLGGPITTGSFVTDIPVKLGMLGLFVSSVFVLRITTIAKLRGMVAEFFVKGSHGC